MEILKKIKKKKFILKNFSNHAIHANIDVQEIELEDDEDFFIKGDFQFVVLNAIITLDFYEVKFSEIHTFESPDKYIHLHTNHCSHSLEENIQKMQSKPNEHHYHKFINYLLKNKPSKPCLLLIGDYQIKRSGHFISNEKQNLFNISDATLQRNSIIFLGEKGTGKSHTLQQYANFRLNREPVFILDTDLGQSMGLPGCVNLLKLDQPIFLKKPQTIYIGFVGEFQVQQHINLYFQKVREALYKYEDSQQIKDYPLLINTAGFVTNYGITIIQELIKCIKPQLSIILAHSHNKSQIIKAQHLAKQLKQKSFLQLVQDDQQFQTEIHILIEEVEFDEEQIQTINNQKTSQQKRENRLTKIANNLNLKSIDYLELCQANYEVINYDEVSFEIINESNVDELSIQEIASCFCFYLVAIERENNCLGIGFIRDFDIEQRQIHIITEVKKLDKIKIIKSKFFDCQIDMHYEIHLNKVLNYLDTQNIENGEPLQYEYQLPYLNVKSQAIGDRNKQVKINKKKFK